MIKNFFKFLILLFFSFLLISCGKKELSPKDDLTIMLPDGQSIYLYMDRKEVEKIIGEPKSIFQDLHEYDGFTVAYTYDKLTCIILYDENYETKSGISTKVNPEILYSLDFFCFDDYNYYNKYYKCDNNNTFSVINDDILNGGSNDFKIFDAAYIYVPFYQKKAEHIFIADFRAILTGYFDE